MSNLILELRGMTEANYDDYQVNDVYYWSDEHLQDILDIHRRDIVWEQLAMYPTQTTGGSSLYKDYRSAFGFYEATTGGTSILYLQDSTGANIGTANYTPDYRRGQFQFSTTQAGSVYYLTGRSYDLNAAAADVWRRKASHYAPTSFNFSTDNHSISRAAVYEHCVQMADFFENQGTQSIQTVSMWRSDVA
jgi:hypothetical protein